MKKILNFLLVVFSLSALCSSSFANKTDSIEQGLKKISTTKLTKTFKAKGLDPIIQDLYAVSMRVGAKYSKVKKNKLGQRVTDKKGKIALIKIVEATHHISTTMEAGTIHYLGPAKLYKNFRIDMNLAIENARIPTEGKQALRSALPNSY